MAASGGSIGFDSSSFSLLLVVEPLATLLLRALLLPLPVRICSLDEAASCFGVSPCETDVDENECSNGFGSRSKLDLGGGRARERPALAFPFPFPLALLVATGGDCDERFIGGEVISPSCDRSRSLDTAMKLEIMSVEVEKVISSCP